MPNQSTRTHTFENASFTARATELAWTFHRSYDTVWDAVVEAASMTGLAVISADRRVGMAVARPPFSLLNVGRRVVFTFSRTDEESTLVRATLLHGYMALQSRRSRQRSLDMVLHMALELIRRSDKDEATLREARQRAEQGRTAPTQKESADAVQQPVTPAESQADSPGQAPAGSGSPTTHKVGTATTPDHPGPAIHPEHPASSPGSGGSTGSSPGPQESDTAADGAARVPHATAEAPRSDSTDLNALHFGDTDWDDLPLTPPSGADASRYRHKSASGSEPGMGKAILWFILGLALAFALSVLAGSLSMLAN